MKYPEAEAYLMQTDSIMGELIVATYPLQQRPSRGGYFDSLARSIVGQQVSTKAAAKIFSRLVEQTGLSPERVWRLTDEQVAVIGLSGQKRRYLSELARHFVEEPAIFNHLENLSDLEVIEELTKVTGIGVWTAQMFLMFTLQRPDIFAPDDRGLQLAVAKHYGVEDKWTKARLEELALRWQPYRSTASLYLWASLDNAPD